MSQEHIHRWTIRLEIFGCREPGCTAIALDDSKRQFLAETALNRARVEVLQLLSEESPKTGTGKGTG